MQGRRRLLSLLLSVVLLTPNLFLSGLLLLSPLRAVEATVTIKQTQVRALLAVKPVLGITFTKWSGSTNPNCSTGSPLPGDWDALTCSATGDVLRMNLRYQLLRGSFPSAISSLFALTQLDLRYNYLNHQFDSFATYIKHLVSIKDIELGLNYLYGSLPTYLLNLATLTRLGVAYNYLIGTVPALPPSVTNLDIRYNLFTDLPTGSLTHCSGHSNCLTTPSKCAAGGNTQRYAVDCAVCGTTNGTGSFCWGGAGGACVPEVAITLVLSWAPHPVRCAGGSVTGMRSNASAAMLALKASLGVTSTTWAATSPCTIKGVMPTVSTWSSLVCDSAGNILSIDLSKQALKGSIHPDISLLTALTLIDFRYNLFNDALDSFSSNLYNLASIKEINLGFNYLYGNLPSSLGKLAALSSLGVGFNYLTGTIPALSTTLNSLDIRANFLTDLPSGSLTSCLGHTNCLVSPSKCATGGTTQRPAPDCAICGTTGATGTFCWGEGGGCGPDAAAAVAAGTVNNDSQPTLPMLCSGGWVVTMASGATAVMLALKSSLGVTFTTWAASVPCRRYDGIIPSVTTWTQVYCSNNGNVLAIALYDNPLSRPLPSLLSALNTSLVELDLSDFFMGASMPSVIFTLTNLRTLNLRNTSLIGSIAQAVGNLEKLRTLNLGSNAIDGAIPAAVNNLKVLENLDLGYNQLSGSLPLMTNNNLMTLNLRRNTLGGTVPASYSSMTRLRDLYLDGNVLEGPLPVSSKASAERIWLSGNRFSGNIPTDMYSYGSVVELSIGGNVLQGSIDSSISKLTSITYLDVSSNKLGGTIPQEISELTRLRRLDMSSNRLSGDIPQKLTGLTQLTVLNLRDNQLSGCVLQPIPASIQQYQLDSNFFSCGFTLLPNCSQRVIAVQANCLNSSGVPPCTTESHSMDPQRVREICASFCSLSPTSPPCGGHGTCFYSGPNKIPTCACHSDYINGEVPGTCVPRATTSGGALNISLLTSVSISSGGEGAEMGVIGEAAVQPGGGIVLTASQHPSWGAAFLVSPIRLFSYAIRNHSCGRDIAFSLSFSFAITPTAGSSGVGAGGFAFVLSASDTVIGGGGGSTVGYAGMDERSLAVEFDTLKDPSSEDPDNSHIGINIGGSVVSIASVAVPRLNSGSTKYAWIDYTPLKGGVLRVFLSSDPSRPTKPTLARSLSLCAVLRPTFEEATFVVGFTGASSDPPQQHVVEQWALDTDFPTQEVVSALPNGFTMSDTTLTTAGANRFFRYASAGALPLAAGAGGGSGGGGGGGAGGGARVQQWAVATNMTWVRSDLLPNWPVRNQAGCGDCWAYAVVASIEAAYAILANNASLPLLSVDLLLSDMKADCAGGSPSKAFQYLLGMSKLGGGLGLEGGAEAKAARWWRGRGGGGIMGSSGAGEVIRGAEVGELGVSNVTVTRGNGRGSRSQGKAVGMQDAICSPLLRPIAELLGVKCGGKKRPGHLMIHKGLTIKGFERTSFYSWFGLILAVQRQPVVVHIEATADSFINYDGLSKYQDPACFTYNLNHVVLLVGYRLVGSDAAFPHMAPPFWIIRNSWGAEWGDGGHMRMDIQGGDGVCGINTLPGIYPIVLDAKDPCNRGAHQDPIGSVFNPCGNFMCSVSKDGNHCDCNTATDGRFIEANNTDGTRTCAYVDACAAHIRNPCVVGTCVNDGRGSYSCVCPPGFRQGTTVDGTFSCAPGSTSGTYTVLTDNIKCSDVFPIYGLSQQQLLLQNPDISCESALPRKSVLNVTAPTAITPCSVYYTTEEGDTCAGLAGYFSLAAGCPSLECTAAFQALNPGVACTGSRGQLQPNQAVCVERSAEAAAALVIPLCSQHYFVESGETCESIRNVPNPPLSPLDFYRLNPGIKCNRLVPKTDVKSFTGFEACVGSTDSLIAGTCPRSKAITIGTGDRCTAIQIKYFRGIKGCYKRINGYECLDRLITGTKVCIPDKVKIAKGRCTV
ncbi:hypothetical protein CLOM_g18244 [Closterium sp. NIES-68]|nr:hypothetical protein CLOM_g18244 [Closterium sp. NIES-68]